MKALQKIIQLHQKSPELNNQIHVSVSEEEAKSFLVTGQSKDSSPSDISCLKEGRECHSALKRVEEMWDKPLEKLEKVDNPTETDETENEKNELVILDCADN